MGHCRCTLACLAGVNGKGVRGVRKWDKKWGTTSSPFMLAMQARCALG